MPTDTQPTPTMSVRPWLAAAVLLAVVFQSVVVSLSPAVSRDGFTFIDMAHDLRTDPVDTMQTQDQHPGFPAMILAGRWLVSPLVDDDVFSWVWGARVVAGLFGLLTLLVAYLAAKRAFDEKTAALAVFLVAVLPLFRLNAADALSDTPHLFFYLLAAWLAMEGLARKRWTWFAGVGASSAAAYWIRPEGLSVVMVTAVVLPLWAWRRRDMSATTAVVFLTVMLATAAVLAAPYWVIAGKLTSKPTTKPYLPPPEEVRSPRAVEFRPAGLGGLLALDGGDASETGAWRLAGEGVLKLLLTAGRSLRWVVALLLVAGLARGGLARSQGNARAMVAGLVLVQLALLAWVYYAGRYVSQRHLLPPLALLMPWAAWGTQLCAARVCRLVGVRRPEWLAIAREVVVVLIMLGLVIAVIPRTFTPLHAGDIGLIRTALVLRQQLHPQDRVITNSKYVLFYLFGRTTNVPGSYIGELAPEPVLRPDQAGPPFRFVVITLHDDPLRPGWEDVLRERYKSYPLLGIRAENVRTMVLR